MNKKIAFVIPALVLPFMMVGCQSNKEISSIEVTSKKLVYQVGEVLNKKDFDVKVVYSDDTEKELKTDEWTSKTNFPYRLNTVDRNNGYTSIDVRVGKSKTSYMIGVAPYFEYDTISVGYNDTTNFSVPLLNDEYSLQDKVTFKIYDKSVIDFNTQDKNDIKINGTFTTAQKDSYLWAFLKIDGKETLIDGCTIKAKYDTSNIEVSNEEETKGEVTITSGASAEIPTIKGGVIATKLKACDSGAKTALTSVTLPASLTEIYDSCFSGCTNLSVFDTSLATSLTKIGKEAFKGCSASFTSFDLPSSVISIGDNCFDGCSALKCLNISSDSELTFVGSNAFNGCHSDLFYVDSGAEGTNDTYVKAVVDGSSNNYYILYTLNDSSKCKIDERCKIVNVDCDVTDKDNFVLPEGVEVIGRGALSDVGIESITIPSTVKVIGKDAFNQVKESTTKKITLNNYDNWYYIDNSTGTEELKNVEADNLKDTKKFVDELKQHDIYYID